MTTNEKILETVLLESKKPKDQLDELVSHIKICVAHIVKTIIQPERFGNSWFNSIKGFEKALDNISSPTARKQLGNMIISEYGDQILSIANNELKQGGKIASSNDLQKVINAFGNRVINLADKNKVDAFLKQQILNSNISDINKSKYLQIIDNRR